ncbi:MAG: TonB-dependent receptor [Saprospiraceae bacterium]|nr:TonB-dependent receptor [Saprospiraceae bacterium]
MKKNKVTQSVNWQKIMRISFIQFIFLFVIASFSYAKPTNAQTILEKEVTVKMENVSLKEAIRNLQGQTQVKFVYSSRIQMKEKVSLSVEKAKLATVLDKLLTPAKIGYRVINEQIVLVAEKGLINDLKRQSQGALEEKETETPTEIAVITITGTVADATTGEKLPGVSIAVKGTTTGTVTDLDGAFSLSVPDDKAVLLFSLIGYLKQEVSVGNKTEFNVLMQTDDKVLEQVVIVGYGADKKANLTGAVSSVKMNDIDGLPISNAATALQGRMAGVTVSSFTGQPGKNDPVIRIRGIGTFGSNAPLVVIDGVPNEVGALGDISVDDIEAVSVLKDAASASIYGVRAANGVILVTTKRGATGKPKIQYRATYSTQKPLIKPRYMDGVQWATAYNDFLTETGAAPAFTEAMIQKIKDGSDPDNFANVDWFDAVYKPAPLNMQFLSASGGTDATKYLVSVEYSDQKGIMDNTNANRLQFRANLDSKISNHLSFGVNLRGFKQGINEPIAAANQNDDGDNGINRIISGFVRPTVPVRYSFGQFGLFDGTDLAQIKNPIRLLNEQKNNTQNYRLDGKIFGQLKFLNGFSFTSSLAYVYSSTLNYRAVPSVFQYRPDGSLFNTTATVSSARNSSTLFTRYVVENLLRYEKVFNKKHDLKVLVGQTAQRDATNSFDASVRNLPSNDVVVLGASAELPTVGGSASALTLQSFLGRINYSFSDRYLLELNARVDGTSRLPASQQYPVFPSASAGWVISNEPFFKNLTKYVEFVKLRASWGQLGNQDIGNYSFTQNYSLNQNYIFSDVLSQGVAINALSNSNIQWEKTTQANIGIDIELPNRLLRIEADVFDKNTSNILVQLPIPNTLGGLTAPNQNAGSVSNKGVELLVSHGNRIGKFEYDISLNGSMVENKITSTAGRTGWITGATINEVGYPINSFFGYEAQGLFRTQAEVDASPKQFGVKPRIGDIKYRDVNGNGDVTTDDRVIIGNPFPKLTYGANIGMKYAGFDVTAFFQGISGITRYYEDQAAMANRSQKLIIWNERWTTANPEGNLPRWGNPTNNNAYSTFRMQDASYVRLKNFEVGYSVPKALLKRVHLSNLRVYFNGLNLWTLADNKDYDVEKSDTDQRSLDYMNTKSISFGLSASF